jgi:cytoskeleton protein RodZ
MTTNDQDDLQKSDRPLMRPDNIEVPSQSSPELANDIDVSSSNSAEGLSKVSSGADHEVADATELPSGTAAEAPPTMRLGLADSFDGAAEPEELEEDIEVLSPGLILREAREEASLTQEQIAARLNLRLQVIKDIERDHFDKKISTTFSKGYLKSYARLLGVSESLVIDGFAHLNDANEHKAELQSFSRRIKQETHNSRLNMVSYLVALVILVMMVVWWLQEKDSMEQEELIQISKTLAEQNLDVQTETPFESETPFEPKTVAQAPEEPVEASASVVKTPDESGADLPLTPVETVTLTSAASQTAAESVQEAPVVLDEKALILSFSEVSWVHVKDSRDKTLAIGEKGPDSPLELHGVPPYKVVIGAPQVVELSYGGEVIDLSRYANRVARLTVAK